MGLIQEFPIATAFNLANFLPVEKDTAVAKTIFHRDNDLTIYIRALDAGETFGTHTVNFEAIVQVLEGSATITVNDFANIVKAGEAIVIPEGATHSVVAITAAKLYVTAVYPTAKA